MLFENKVVLITGAASGIGRTSAMLFAREGAKLMLSDVNDDGGSQTVDLIRQGGGTAVYQHCDVSNADEVARLLANTQKSYGGLHYAVNNAGISGTFLNPITETEEAVYDAVMAVNVKGVWLCMKAEIPVILASGGGSIVNLASVAGLIGAPGGAVYAASKHAVIGLTRSVGLEYARQGLRVNAICPSYIETPMVTNLSDVDPKMAERTQKASPMKRLGQPEEVAEAVIWLCSEKASFINGTTLAIDGGLTAS